MIKELLKKIQRQLNPKNASIVDPLPLLKQYRVLVGQLDEFKRDEWTHWSLNFLKGYAEFKPRYLTSAEIREFREHIHLLTNTSQRDFWSDLLKNRIVEYVSSNIQGYQGEKILVNSDFIDSMDLINNYAITNNVIVSVTDSFRPKGTSVQGSIVPPSEKSNHKVGHAIDMNLMYDANNDGTPDTLANDKYLGRVKSDPNSVHPDVRNFVEAIRNDPKLRWGGDFPKIDPVHIDDGLNVNNQKLWEQKYNTLP
ncbi:M15 family metallopeptidase [Microseira sp. BLCC-F43]|uniref:M15 family metallopeptidase n=1 Tax=Microseira sp. BLCC-F43 TaxID=3153602 RepID=UPI0035B738C7